MIRTAVLIGLVALVGCKPPVVNEPPAQPVEEAQGPWDGTGAVYAFSHEESWNMHHDFGASGMRRYSDVSMVLGSEGQVRIFDVGTMADSQLSNDYGHKEDKTTWSNTWLGTWVDGDDGGLVVTVHIDHRECTEYTEQYGGSDPQEKKCPPVGDRVLKCRADRVDAGDHEGENLIDVWMCWPEGEDTDMGGTPTPWVFGKDHCVVKHPSIKGMSGSYEICENSE